MTKRSLLRNVSIGIGSVRSSANRRRKLNKSNRVGWAAPSVFYLSPTILSYDLVSRVCPSASTILSSVYNPKEPRTNPLSEIFRGLLLPVVTRRNGPVRKNLALSDPPSLSTLFSTHKVFFFSSPCKERVESKTRLCNALLSLILRSPKISSMNEMMDNPSRSSFARVIFHVNRDENIWSLGGHR